MAEPAEENSAPCRPHERPWRNRCVDRGLTDDWLERLNELSVFELISICEGHGADAESDAFRLPHINLRLREQPLDLLSARWPEIRTALGDELERSFTSPHASAHLEFRGGYIKDDAGLFPQDIALLKIASRTSPPFFDAGDYGPAWFEENIAAAEHFDGAAAAILGVSSA